MAKAVGIHFEAADGGIMSHTETKMKSAKGSGPLYNHETVKTVHPTMEHAVKHLQSKLGYCYANAPESGQVQQSEAGGEE